MKSAGIPWWAWTWPLLAWLILLITFFPVTGLFPGAGGLIAVLSDAALIATVFAAVHHAEVVAHRTGEPFGTLVLAVAVTVIEVALIVSVMIAAPAEKAGLARDTVFAAVMIVCNGIVGVCLLWGGARHHQQGFQVHGASAALAVLAALTVLTLVLPNFSTSAPGPLFSTPQLVFAGIVSLVLYGSFVFIQTVRHQPQMGRIFGARDVGRSRATHPRCNPHPDLREKGADPEGYPYRVCHNQEPGRTSNKEGESGRCYLLWSPESSGTRRPAASPPHCPAGPALKGLTGWGRDILPR